MQEPKINYDKRLESLVEELKKRGEAGGTKKLLLHACCAPCSSHVLEYLTEYFSIYMLYYNPNIAPFEEFILRKNELEILLSKFSHKNPIELLPVDYRAEDFSELVIGLEEEPEGGARCMVCYELRMREAAVEAKRLGCDYFATTLTISPMKNAKAINIIGEALEQEYGVKHLPGDFKKKNGYKRSIELSKNYGLYRQDYCGCIYSKRQRERQRSEQEGNNIG